MTEQENPTQDMEHPGGYSFVELEPGPDFPFDDAERLLYRASGSEAIRDYDDIDWPEAASFALNLADTLENPNASLFGAFKDNQLVAIGACDTPIDFGHFGVIESLATAEGHQNNGLASRLLKMCEARLRKRGKTTVLLVSTIGAIDFYAKAGYQPSTDDHPRMGDDQMYKDLA